MNKDAAFHLAKELQSYLNWDQGNETLNKLVAFIQAHYNDSHSLEENIHNLITLYEKDCHAKSIRVGKLHRRVTRGGK